MEWCSAEKTGVSTYTLKFPYNNVVVGSDPRDGMTREYADSFDAIVNVSDSIGSLFEPSNPSQRTYWYPVNEIGRWNMSFIYWLKKILDHHHELGHRIYLHCHAGAYRSPSTAVLWLQSRDHTDREAMMIGTRRGEDSSLYRLWESYGNIPKTKDLIYEMMNEHPTWSLAGIIMRDRHWNEDVWNPEIAAGYCRKTHLLRHYFWFYYKPKAYIKDRIEKIGYFFKKKGYRKEGCCTSIYRRKYYWALPKNAVKEEQ